MFAADAEFLISIPITTVRIGEAQAAVEGILILLLSIIEVYFSRIASSSSQRPYGLLKDKFLHGNSSQAQEVRGQGLNRPYSHALHQDIPIRLSVTWERIYKRVCIKLWNGWTSISSRRRRAVCLEIDSKLLLFPSSVISNWSSAWDVPFVVIQGNGKFFERDQVNQENFSSAYGGSEVTWPLIYSLVASFQKLTILLNTSLNYIVYVE